MKPENDHVVRVLIALYQQQDERLDTLAAMSGVSRSEMVRAVIDEKYDAIVGSHDHRDN